jgi:hypothetical protein
VAREAAAGFGAAQPALGICLQQEESIVYGQVVHSDP